VVRRLAAIAVGALLLPAAASATPPRVSVTRLPAELGFGDELRLRVDVRFDPQQVDPAKVHVGGFAPWVVIRGTRTVGDRKLTVALDLLCLRATCLGKHEGVARRFDLAAAVTWNGPGGAGSGALRVPQFRVASRVTPEEKLVPRFKVRLEPLPRFAYRFRPATGAIVAFAAAGALALAAVGLLVLAFGGRRRVRHGGQRLSGLERALLIVRRAAAAGAPGERRRALDRLARELEATPAADLGERARRLAWSSEPPEPAAVARVADDVERAAGAARADVQ
jgi:hypothetical protein